MITIGLVCFFFNKGTFAQKNKIAVLAYYAGGPSQADSFDVKKLTHMIFSFCHLKGNRLDVANIRDTVTILRLVDMKKVNPDLKVILSLGGWGGCATCSDVFSTEGGRKEFAESVKELSEFFHTDGIDLDWEYPTIEGYPGHKYQPDDKKNFTSLVKQLRKTLGKHYEISFAAGGFEKYIDEAVDWKKEMKYVDRVNLMTYDLVNGYSTVTGHHTPLYSTSKQIESTDNAVNKLIKIGVAKNKLAIGAAFYGRMWEGVPDSAIGLYQQGHFKTGVSYKNFATQLSADSGFVYHWDEKAQAPYLYNPRLKLFVTYDDKKSIELKTKYVIEKGLNGIMFWQLTEDTYTDGLLDEIDKVRSTYAIK
ncbi:MAG TPA: glycoside hydrolase family 18 protein [Flavisolibacter sp.]|nr:glycoside hydrolase family 18 protein [Flavisolibacter sp.]